MAKSAVEDSSWAKKLGRILRRELSPEWTGFNGVHPKRFATPQFPIPFQPISWIILRFIVAVYLDVWLFVIFIKWGTTPYYPKAADSRWKVFLYASNWAYVTVCFYFTFAAISTLTYHMRTMYTDTSSKVNKEELEINNLIEAGSSDPNKGYILPGYVKFTWFLKNIIYSAIILTSFLRWAVDTGEPFQYNTNASDVHVHGIGLAFVAVDFILIASPYRLQHMVYPMLTVLCYYIFTLLYYFAGGTNHHHKDKDIDGDTYLYREKVDWGRFPKTTTFFAVIMIFVGLPLTHLCIYLLFKFKQLMIEWYYFNKEIRLRRQ